MKNPVPLLGLLLIGWISGGAYLWYNNSCCASTAIQSSFLVQDGATTIASAPQNVLFSFSGAVPNTSAIDTELQKLATYLKDHPYKALVLTGLYRTEEQNNTSFANLGLARADALSARLIEMGVPAYQLQKEGKLDQSLSFQEETTAGGISYGIDEIDTRLHINDGSAFNSTAEDNLRFKISAFNPNQPLSTALQSAFQQTADYLKSSPMRSLKITGLYTQQEDNQSMLANLGLARANSIKNILTGMGVDPTQLEIDGVLEDDGLPVIDGALPGPARYTFFETPETGSNRLAEVERRLKASNLVLYFNTNQPTINLNAQQRRYLADLIYYLDNKKDGRVQVTGHTDNRGDAGYNRQLAKQRADFVRDYITKNGINATKISTASQGPDQPIASNATVAGRAKNRRVEISIN